ncbi:MAG: methionyl-tRNA formyltransferase, partial [Anaerolineae bacterium]|nr:methionyl-tRNA formyltransferase [Anaerolineae bacterium]
EHEVLAVVTQPDRPAGRGRVLTPPPVKEVASSQGVPVFQPHALRGNEALLERLRGLAPQVVVVAAFGMLLPPVFLALPPKGCLNVHASLLPRHRGAAPVAGAILAGDRETGVTIMLMDEGLDTGPILSQVRCPIAEEDTTGSLTARLAELGRDLLLETLPRWVAGEITPRPQDEARATYAPALRKADAEMDWSKPAALLAREVRAFNPWPGSYTFWQGRRIKVLRARAVEGAGEGDTPGKVIWVGSLPGVCTGDGVLLLEEVQPAGKPPMSGAAFCRGQRGLVGSVLGA